MYIRRELPTYVHGIIYSLHQAVYIRSGLGYKVARRQRVFELKEQQKEKLKKEKHTEQKK